MSKCGAAVDLNPIKIIGDFTKYKSCSPNKNLTQNHPTEHLTQNPNPPNPPEYPTNPASGYTKKNTKRHLRINLMMIVSTSLSFSLFKPWKFPSFGSRWQVGYAAMFGYVFWCKKSSFPNFQQLHTKATKSEQTSLRNHHLEKNRWIELLTQKRNKFACKNGY